MKKTPPSKNSYNKILSNIINHIEQLKLRAFTEVNKALLEAYWSIGKEISKNSSYGKSVVEQLSKDLKLRYPYTRGYSERNLWNMKHFYETYQKARLFGSPELQSNPDTYHKKLQTLSAESKGEKLQALPAELLFKVS